MQFQSGALMGSLIALGTTVSNGTAASIGTGLYLAFIIIMVSCDTWKLVLPLTEQFVGSGLTWCILPPSKVIRQDGTVGTFCPVRRGR